MIACATSMPSKKASSFCLKLRLTTKAHSMLYSEDPTSCKNIRFLEMTTSFKMKGETAFEKPFSAIGRRKRASNLKIAVLPKRKALKTKGETSFVFSAFKMKRKAPSKNEDASLKTKDQASSNSASITSSLPPLLPAEAPASPAAAPPQAPAPQPPAAPLA